MTTYETLEEAKAAAEDAYAAVVTRDGQYVVPAHNDYMPDGRPVTGAFDWYLNRGWKQV